MLTDSRDDINIETPRLLKGVAEFAVDFIKCLPQAPSNATDQPVAAETVKEAFSKFKTLTHNRDEITFIVSSYPNYKDIFLEGILSESIKLTGLLKEIKAEHFVSNFIKFMAKNHLISITIKSRIENNEFEKFINLLWELPLMEKEVEKSRGEFDPFSTHLLKNKVNNVTVIFISDIIGTERAILWQAKAALTKIWKELKVLPLQYRNLRGQEVFRLRGIIFKNTLKSIQTDSVVKEIVTNLDLIEQTLTETQKFDIEKEFINCLSETQLYRLCSALLEETEEIVSRLSPQQVKSREILIAGHRNIRLLRKCFPRLKEKLSTISLELLEEMFKKGLIPQSELPEALQFKLKIGATASQFLDNEEAYLKDFRTTNNPKSYQKYLTIFEYILPELIKRKKFDSIDKVIKIMNDHMNDPVPPFDGRAAYIENALAKLRTKDIFLANLANEFKTDKKDDREIIGNIFLLLGKESVPKIISLLSETEDATLRREICSLLEKFGETARSQIVDELRTFRHNWQTVRNLLAVLSSVGTEEDANRISRYLSHYNPKVREETMNTVTKLAGKKVEYVLIEKLKDPEPLVVTAAVRLLAEIKSTSPSFLMFIAEALRRKTGRETLYPDSVVIACARAITNYASYEFPDHPPLEDIILQNFRSRTLKELLFANLKGFIISSDVRTAMIEALGHIGTLKSEDILDDLMKKSDEKLKASVSAALEKIRERRTAVVVNKPLKF